MSLGTTLGEYLLIAVLTTKVGVQYLERTRSGNRNLPTKIRHLKNGSTGPVLVSVTPGSDMVSSKQESKIDTC